MRRTLVQPADVSTALAELKTWLAISRPNEDALLESLLRAGIEACEGFTGQAPLSQIVEEAVPVCAGSHALSSRPVRAFLAVDLVAADGSRKPLEPDDYEFAIESDGSARIELPRRFTGRGVTARFEAGLADGWGTLPAPLKQGVIRLAAFEYRERDRSGAAAADNAPPASVIALWRPWRIVRLA